MKLALIVIIAGIATGLSFIAISSSFKHAEAKIADSTHTDFKVHTVPDCSYVLPKQYFLVRSETTGKYAIRFMHIDTYPHYLGYMEFSTMPPLYSNMNFSNEAATFDDSCSAKGFAKICISKVNSGTDEDYKNVK